MNIVITIQLIFIFCASVFLIITSDWIRHLRIRHRCKIKSSSTRRDVLEHPEKYKGRCVYFPNAFLGSEVRINEFCWQPIFNYDRRSKQIAIENNSICPCSKCSPYMEENIGFEVLKDG